MKTLRLVLLLATGLVIGFFAGDGWGKPALNSPPVIAGTPATAVEVGHFYSFLPQASDAEGDRLSFTISNKPAWAAFNRKTGGLTGTPSAASVGTYTGIRIQVSDRLSTASLAPFDISVGAAPASNRAPLISGTPGTTARAGAAYSFLPKASDPDGDALVFSIVNKPAWAYFDTANGALTGTPGAGSVGVTTGIVIQASDGGAQIPLPAFDLTVVPANEATLSWVAPSAREDGTAFSLSDIGGYRVYHGSSATQMYVIAELQDPTGTRYTLTDLDPGTHYFALTVYDLDHVESVKSAVLVKTVQ